MPVDLWLDEHRGYAYYWDANRLRDEIQHEFFNITPPTYFLAHGGECLHQLWQEKRYSTLDLRENSLKVFLKYQMLQKRQVPPQKIRSLYLKTEKAFTLLEKYQTYDADIRGLDYRYFTKFKSFLVQQYPNPNTARIHLSVIKLLMNEASRKFPALKNHHPLEEIRIRSQKTEPNPLTIEELNDLRHLNLKKGFMYLVIHFGIIIVCFLM